MTRRVALINMPFGAVERPSIQCGLLKASLERSGYPTDVYYLNLELSAFLGPKVYAPLSDLRANLLIGEWLFSYAAFGPMAEGSDDYRALPALQSFCDEVGSSIDTVRDLRATTLPAWVNAKAKSVDWSKYLMVGFTSTFEQNNASFALARAIKDDHPNVPTVFGGANFDGDMGKEYVRALPFVDFAVVGEGDQVVVALAEAIASGVSPLGIKGVIGIRDGEVAGDAPAPTIREMNGLPDPDYRDYFATLSRLSPGKVFGHARPPVLLIESSRGCWWGQKHHCTFCGLNANGMTYRSKSGAETIAQMRRLSERYHLTDFEAVDNIMDYRFLESLCNPLAAEKTDYRLFYEVKANLKRENLASMASAGIRAIQPGIESLNTHVLSLMRKGTTMLHNVRLLKWAQYYGIEVAWNILTGFPGECAEDYSEQERLLPMLTHLQPPARVGRIWLERFSPYYFDASFPVKNVKPLEAYRFIYPTDRIDVEKVAYFFDYEMDGSLPQDSYDPLHRRVKEWQEKWMQPNKPRLMYQRAHDWMRIHDRRSGTPVSTVIDGVDALVYDFCVESERTVHQILEHYATSEGVDLSEPTVRAALTRFEEQQLLISENGKFFSLATPMNRNW